MTQVAWRSQLSQFRWWYRRSLWLSTLVQPDGWRGRARFVASRILRPWFVLREAQAAVEKYGGQVERVAGVTRRRQLTDVVLLAIRHGMPPDSYYLYGLFEPDRRTDARYFLHQDEHHRVLMTLVHRQSRADAHRIDDKKKFHDWCRVHGFPTPELVATFHGGDMSPTVVRFPDGMDLVSKPTDSRWGRGVRVWRRAGDGCYIDQNGSRCQPHQLLRELRDASCDQPYLLQERLANHESLQALAGTALATARVVTGRDPEGPVAVLDTYFRIGRLGAVVDNSHAGGIAAPVDPVEGRLGAAVSLMPDSRLRSYGHHPDSEVVILGQRLPDWEEAIRMVMCAHQVAGQVSFIGWDVALTSRGPVLIEANVSWEQAQGVSGLPLGRGPYVSWVLAHLRQTRRTGALTERIRGRRSRGSCPSDHGLKLP